MKPIEDNEREEKTEIEECIENSFDAIDINSDLLASDLNEVRENIGRDHQVIYRNNLYIVFYHIFAIFYSNRSRLKEKLVCAITKNQK